jgi:hypothetical protein
MSAVGDSAFFRNWLFAALLGVFAVVAPASFAQQPGSSKFEMHAPVAVDESSTRLIVEPPPPTSSTPETHRFWDRENILLFSGVAIFRGLDYASTRNMQARGRKEILLAPEVVNNDAAFASLEAAGTMTSIGVSYIFHRTGHHKLERWMSIGHIGVAAFGDVRNYCLVSKHPR